MMINLVKFSSFAFALLVAFTACGTWLGNPDDEKSDDDEQKFLIVEEELPSDSSGTSSSVVLKLTSNMPTSGLRMVEESAETLKISDTITLTSARLCLAKIRLAAASELSAAEAAYREDELQEEIEVAEDESSILDELASIDEEYRERIGNANSSKKDEVRAERNAKKAEKQMEQANKHRAQDVQRLERDSTNDKTIKLAGPFVYDAISKKVESGSLDFSVLDGTYKRIEFQLKQYRNGDEPTDDPLLNASFRIAGTFLKDGAEVPFVAYYHVSENIRLTSESGIKIAPDATNNLFVAFDLASWFAEVDMSSATLEDDVVLIDKNRNHDLLMKIKGNITNHVNFGLDANGDDELQADEVAGSASEG